MTQGKRIMELEYEAAALRDAVDALRDGSPPPVGWSVPPER